jgi:hypothetical protein
MKEMQEKATVRLVGRGEEHPYVIEVTTPGWRGVEAAFEGPIELPDDLEQILAVLGQAGVEPSNTLFMADGATEIVLKDSGDFELAIKVLARGGWLSPEAPSAAAIN